MSRSTPLNRLLKKTSYQQVESGITSNSLMKMMDANSMTSTVKIIASEENKKYFIVGKSLVGGGDIVR